MTAASSCGRLGNVRISARGRLAVFDHGKPRRAPRVHVYYAGIRVSGFLGGWPREGGGARGVVQGFSVESRRRFRLRLMEVDWSAVDTAWVTLTYHDQWGESWQSWKRDLRAFQKRLDRSEFRCVFDTWRLEFQRRGAPHFHLICAWLSGFVPDFVRFRAWVRRAWAEVIGACEDLAHLRWGTKVVQVTRGSSGDGLGQLMGYICKDQMKVDQAVVKDRHVETGRVWGIRGRPPVREVRDIEVDEVGLEEICRRLNVMGRGKSWYLESLSTSYSGFVVLGDGERLLDRLLEGVEHVVVSS